MCACVCKSTARAIVLMGKCGTNRTERMTKRKAPSTPGGKKKRLAPMRRREMVKHYVEVYSIESPVEIARRIHVDHGYRCDRHTIKDDLNVLFAEVDQWVHSQTRYAMLQKVRHITTDMFERNEQLKDVIDQLLSQERKVSPELIEYLKQSDDESLLEQLKKLVQAVQLVRVAGKVGYLNTVITESQKEMITIMERIPLHLHSQDLAKYYDEHRPVEVASE